MHDRIAAEFARLERQFADHIIAERTGDRILIKRPDSQHLAAYIIKAGGRLIICGDIELTAFAYGSGGLRAMVNWVANSSITYLCEKYCAGSGESAYRFCPEAAARDLKEHRDDIVPEWIYVESGDDDVEREILQEKAERAFDDIESALTYYENYGEQSGPHVKFLCEAALYELFEYGEMVGNFGTTVKHKVIVAIAAARRCAQLLDA